MLQGDSQTPNALHVSGGGSVNTVYIDGDLYVSGKTDTGNKIDFLLDSRCRRKTKTI